MRAWTFTTRGPPSAVLKLRDDLPRPTSAQLRADEVLVKVSHVGIFQGFTVIMGIAPHLTSKPWIPAHDFSGTVEATGSDVTNVQPGDPVFGGPDPKAYMRWGSRYNGILAEYAILPAVQVVRKPANISFAAAATLPCNGCTATQFADKVGMKKGDRVLITAASGGLGTVMVQVARALVGEKGTVVGTCSANNEALVKKLGADEVVDYKAHPVLHEYLALRYSTRPFNAIIDISGADELLYDKSPLFLEPDGVFLAGGKLSVTHGGGRFLDILSFILNFQKKMHWPRILGGTPRKGVFHSGNVGQEGFLKTAKLVEAGQLTGVVDSEYAMEDALKAYESVAMGRARGKIVVKVQDFSN